MPMNAYPQKEHYTADDLLAILAILRDPENGCPWDKVQTHTSIRMNFLEEAYEAVDAIDLDDPELLCEELGDVLMQVGFHTQIEQEAGRFTWQQVCDGVCRKLIDRHPHIFGGDTSIKDKLQERAARGGVTVTTDPAELETLARRVEAGDNAEAALGELLFKTAALARLAGLDPEQALQKANAAFTAATHQL